MPRKLPTFLQDDQPERMLRATTTERDRVLLMALLYLGLRNSEACKLQVEHIDFRRKLLFVREGKGRDGGKDRCLPIPSRFVGPLRGFVGSRRQGYVFLSRKGGRLKPRAIQLLVKRIAARAGLSLAPRVVTPHKFRHSFCTRMLDRDVPIHVVQQAMGHADLSSTQVYAHCSPQLLRDGMEI